MDESTVNDMVALVRGIVKDAHNGAYPHEVLSLGAEQMAVAMAKRIHDKLPAPIDPDLLAVREILSETYRKLENYGAAQGILLGRWDGGHELNTLLEAYRAGKAAKP